MTNAETILKLNEALTSLIKAYEELQGENGVLKQRVNELEDEVLNLELIKEDLEKSVNELKSNTEDDKKVLCLMIDEKTVNFSEEIPFIRTLFKTGRHFE